MGQKPESAEHLIERVKHALDLLGTATIEADYGSDHHIVVYASHGIGRAEIRAAYRLDMPVWKIDLYASWQSFHTEYVERSI